MALHFICVTQLTAIDFPGIRLTWWFTFFGTPCSLATNREVQLASGSDLSCSSVWKIAWFLKPKTFGCSLVKSTQVSTDAQLISPPRNAASRLSLSCEKWCYEFKVKEGGYKAEVERNTALLCFQHNKLLQLWSGNNNKSTIGAIVWFAVLVDDVHPGGIADAVNHLTGFEWKLDELFPCPYSMQVYFRFFDKHCLDRFS